MQDGEAIFKVAELLGDSLAATEVVYGHFSLESFSASGGVVDNLDFIASRIARPGEKVLDFGCGAGELVARLLSHGADAYGCDVFYGGGSYESSVPAALQPRIRKSTPLAIPFDDAAFDTVVSHTVLEHVPDLEGEFREMRRVLRPRGIMLHIFPHRETWREAHIGVPFLHRVPLPAARLYARAWRAFGGGLFHGGKPRGQWADDACDWLKNWTHYRTFAELDALFRRYGEPEYLEADWLAARIPKTNVLPAGVRTIIARKMAGVAVLIRCH